MSCIEVDDVTSDPLTCNEQVIPYLNEYQVASLQMMQKMEREPIQYLTDNRDLITIMTDIGFLANRVGSGKTRVALALALSPFTRTTLTTAHIEELEGITPVLKTLMAGNYHQKQYKSNRPEVYNSGVSRHKIQLCTELSAERGGTLIVVQSHLRTQWERELEVLGLDKDHLPDCLEITYLIREPFHDSAFRYEEAYYVMSSQPRYKTYDRVIHDECISDGRMWSKMPSPNVERRFTWILSATIAKDISCKYGREPWTSNFTSGNSNFFTNLPSLTIRVKEEFIQRVATYPEIIYERYTVHRPRLTTMQPEAGVIPIGSARAFLEGLLFHTRQGRDTQELRQKIERLEAQLNEVASGDHCGCCLDDPTQPVITGCCQSVFCKRCMQRCDHRRCPMCRHTPLSYYLKKEVKSRPARVRKQPFDILTSLIDTAKTYLVVGRDRAITSLGTALREAGINSKQLTETTAGKVIEEHRAKVFPAILLDASYFGTGLDMTYIDEIIVYAPLSQSSMVQALGRLCRMNRTRPIRCHVFKWI